MDESKMYERRFKGDFQILRSPERIALLEVDRVVQGSLDGSLVHSILDIGTGSGVFAEAFSKLGLRVVGIDTNVELLELAQEYVPMGVFQQAAAEELPFADGTFDLVFLGHVLHETDSPVKALREARRVVRRRVMVLEWPYLEEEQGPPLEDRLRQENVEKLATQAEYIRIERIELMHMDLYRLDPGTKIGINNAQI